MELSLPMNENQMMMSGSNYQAKQQQLVMVDPSNLDAE
jgi:hypothetical protein